MNKLSQVCNFCNNTSEHCCPESDKNYEAQAHIIDAQDEHRHDHADSHVFIMHGLLASKDVVRQLEQGGN